jgi:hypothetical protein
MLFKKEAQSRLNNVKGGLVITAVEQSIFKPHVLALKFNIDYY